MRLVQEMGAFAHQAERNANLFANRVRPRALGHAAEVRPELRRHVHILRPAQKDVLGLLIEPRQPAHHIANVGADAEVMELPRVDRDSHYADYGGLRR